MNNQESTVIFDFDGTLIDSFDIGIEILNLLADELNFRKINLDEHFYIRDLSSRELIKYLEIPAYKIPKLLYLGRHQMRSEMPKLSPFPHILETLKGLHDANFSIGILTSNSLENVTAWLELHNMSHFFSFIHSGSSYFGKTRLLKKILKKYNVNPSNAFYVGDETRDVEAAKQSKMSSIAVTWGFNSEKALLRHHPQYVVKQPKEILTLLQNYLPV